MKSIQFGLFLGTLGYLTLGTTVTNAQGPADGLVGSWVTTQCIRVPNPPGATLSTRTMTYEITFTSSGTFFRSGTLYIGGICSTSGWGAQSLPISDGGTYVVGNEISTRDGNATELDLAYSSSSLFTIFRIDADRLILGDPSYSQKQGDSASERLNSLGRVLKRKPTAP